MKMYTSGETTRLAVIGLGNMGVSVAAAALRRGFRVVAMDVDVDKVEMTNRGQCVVPEPGIGEVFAAARRDGQLVATTNLEQTVATTDVCFMAVPTPPDDVGDIDYRVLLGLLDDLRAPIAARDRRYDLVLGSTVFPGVTRGELLPRLAPLRLGGQFQFAISPVFLRAGSGMEDYLDPGRVVVGMEGPHQDGVREYFTRLFPDRDDVWFVDFDTAECVKAVHNAWMSMKVVFANETGQWCRSVGVDGRKVMDIVLSDTQRLLSRSHLRPGPPYSGPCLPKDALALRRHLTARKLACPLFEAIHESNVVYKQSLFEALLADGSPSDGLGVLGVAFKPDFNEPRWSIATELMSLARERNWRVCGYDRAFVGCEWTDFALACRGATQLHSLHDSIRLTLAEVWNSARRIFLNMNLNRQERAVIESLQRREPQRRLVVDVYGTLHNQALAELPMVAYRGAAWLPPKTPKPRPVAIGSEQAVPV